MRCDLSRHVGRDSFSSAATGYPLGPMVVRLRTSTREHVLRVLFRVRMGLAIGAASLVVVAAGVRPATAEVAPPDTPDPVVIVLSLDGVRHDYLARDRESLPSLSRVAREGLAAVRMTPVFPSSTFPNHVSLATGVSVDRHGIVANEFFDRDRGEFSYDNDASWIRSEPLWVTAERQGRRAAVFFWVGSETDWQGVGATHRMAPFDSAIGETAKVDRILSWLDLPAAERPQLVMSWWHGADTWGHRAGPDSEQARDQLREQDAELGRLLRGLDERKAWGHTTLVLVSDHGMTEGTELIDPGAALDKAGVTGARIWSATSVAHVFLDEPTPDAVRAAAAALAAVPGVRAVARDALPAELRYDDPTRMGDVVAFTDAPRFLGKPWSLKGVAFEVTKLLGTARGMHGYPPASTPEMHGIFLATGRGVPAGATPERVSALDLATTVAALLGIDPPKDAEGRIVEAIEATLSGTD